MADFVLKFQVHHSSELEFFASLFVTYLSVEMYKTNQIDAVSWEMFSKGRENIVIIVFLKDLTQVEEVF